jgi:predicted PurR-regulated permease PerM
MPKKIEISHRTIIFTAVFIGILWLVTRIWDIILLLFVSLILMAALKPAVDTLEKLKLPRSLAIIIVYIFLWALVGSVVASLIPPLVDQTRKLILILPRALSNFDYLSSHQQEISGQLLSSVGTIPESIFKITVSVFGNILNLITTIVLSFYLLLERKNLDRHLSSIFPEKFIPEITRIIYQIEIKLGGWIRGELFLMTIVGIMTYVGLFLLGIETALPLAILAGMLEIVPTIGPFVSAVPAVIIATVVHPLLGLSTAALYFLVQFAENNLLVPQIMRKTTGVSPLLSILGLMVGFRLGGVVGAVLAIPAILVIQTLGVRFFSLSRLEDISDKT